MAEALLAAWQAISGQAAILSRRLIALARQDQAVRRLMTAPGVGVVLALAYVSGIDDPERFARSSSVGAYVGLTPRRDGINNLFHLPHQMPAAQHRTARS